jgi:hypothetical protein
MENATNENSDFRMFAANGNGNRSLFSLVGKR